MAPHERTVRRGLPRVSGGSPWPPEGAATPAAADGGRRREATPPSAARVVANAARETTVSAPKRRRGLPRRPGTTTEASAGTAAGDRKEATRPGHPDDQEETAAVAASAAAGVENIGEGVGAERVSDSSGTADSEMSTAASIAAREASIAAREAAVAEREASVSVREGALAEREQGGKIAGPGARIGMFGRFRAIVGRREISRKVHSDPEHHRRLTRREWLGVAVAAVIALAGAVTIGVLTIRWFLDLDFMRDFLATYPGEYHLPEWASVGVPGWLNWSHFFNAFLMVLAISTGLRVRFENRPMAFWTPKRNDKGKISLTLWLHNSLDLLWIVNGLVFLILLFATDQWVRIVPTSWEVFPNALSAVLQYASLDWPTENGWVNYNSLQQLAYFATVFVAAPLATVTGVRLSGLWPKNAKTLNRIYPIQLARTIHFPVMLYFAAFIIIHVTLVFTTGVLRNLNHMFAARGSSDPSAYTSDWTGLGVFLVAVVVTVAALIATTKPLVIASIASLFGKVSSR